MKMKLNSQFFLVLLLVSGAASAVLPVTPQAGISAQQKMALLELNRKEKEQRALNKGMSAGAKQFLESLKSGDIWKAVYDLNTGGPFLLDELSKYPDQIRPIIKTKDTTGNTLLMEAVKLKYLPVVKFLLEHGANIDATDNDGNTILHLAVKVPSLALIELLLLPQYKADIFAKNKNGETSLDLAKNSHNL